MIETASRPLRLLAVVTLLVLATGGGVPAAAATMAGLGLLPTRPLVRPSWTLFHTLALIVAGVLGALLGAVVGFSVLVCWLLFHRVRTARSAGDVQLALLITLLVLLLACVASVSAVLFPALLATAALGPVVLLRAQGIAAPSLERGVGLSVVLVGVALFGVLPRLQGGMLEGIGGEDKGSAFPSDVTLGDGVDGGDDSAIVMRVRVDDGRGVAVPGPFYLRGRSLDFFDGHRWTAEVITARIQRRQDWNWHAQILLEPLESDVLFVLPEVVKVGGLDDGLFRDVSGDWHHRSPGQRLGYDVWARTTRVGKIRSVPSAYLQLPELDPKVRAIANSIAPGGDSDQIITSALALLSDGYTYTDNPPIPAGDPLTWFLTEGKTGHCEYFASALTVLLRARGVPARMGTGFYAAEPPDAGGYVVVRRGNAHAWVEVPVEGGWAVVDASPAAGMIPAHAGLWERQIDAITTIWYRFVLDYDLDAQIAALSRIGSVIVPEIPGDPMRSKSQQGYAGFTIVAVVVMGTGTFVRLLLFALSRPRAQATVEGLAGLIRAARQIARKRGWPIPADLPAVEAGEWLVHEAGEPGRPLATLAWLHYRARYGGEPVEVDDARAQLRALKALPKKKR